MAYWRWDNYQNDLDEGAGFHFNSNQALLHQGIEIGERLWLVSGQPTGTGSQYKLVAMLTVCAKTINDPHYKYGRYRVWGDLHTSFYYSANGPALNDHLLLMNFSSGKAIKDPAKIGQSLQTIRRLLLTDSALLTQFAQGLSFESRARSIADELSLEKALDQGEKAIHEVVEKYHVGVSRQRQYVLRQFYPRQRLLVQELQNIYQGRCQLCGYDPQLLYGVSACNGHHIVYLSRGGADDIHNMLLICPNHHQVIHAAEAVFDFKDLNYVFRNGRREPLALNRHLENA